MHGVIDIGSNTMRLSIYKVEKDDIQPMLSKKVMAGLAGYVNESGYMTTRGIDKTIEHLNQFKTILRNIDVKDTYVFATASLRNIKNSKETTQLIEARTGFIISVLTGQEEATLDFIGASLKNDMKDGLLIDIGGGSTELVHYLNGKILHTISLPIGSLNLHNKYVDDFLPTKDEIRKIEKKVLKELAKMEDFPLQTDVKMICGIGGTVRGTCKLKNALFELPSYNRTILTDDMDDILDYFQNKRYDFLTHLIKVIPDRLHTILPGMIILKTIADHFESEIIFVSEFGVREGYLYQKIKNKGSSYE